MIPQGPCSTRNVVLEFQIFILVCSTDELDDQIKHYHDNHLGMTTSILQVMAGLLPMSFWGGKGDTFLGCVTLNTITRSYFHTLSLFHTLLIEGDENAAKYFRNQPGHQRPPPLQLHHTLHPRWLPNCLLGIGTGDGEWKPHIMNIVRAPWHHDFWVFGRSWAWWR